MSFRNSFNDVQLRVWRFQKGAGDARGPFEIICQIQKLALDLQEAVADGDNESDQLPDYTEGEERAAALLTELMFLAESCGWDIPETMSTRNTVIRNDWKQRKGSTSQ